MIAAALLAFDPSYILHIRLDWGPVALMMFFKVGSLYFLAEFARTRKLFYLKVAALFLGLGLYDKANFLWYLLALPLATFVVWGRQFRMLITLRNARQALTFFLLGCWPLLVFNLVTGGRTFKEQITEPENLWTAVRTRTGLLWSTMEGYEICKRVNDGPPPPVEKVRIAKSTIGTEWIPRPLMSGSLLPWMVLITLCVIILLLCSSKAKHRRIVVFILLLATLIQLEIYLTPRTIGSHHIMMLYPFPHLLLAHVFALLTSRDLPWFEGRAMPRKFIGRLTAAALGVLIISNLIVNVRCIRSFRKEGGRFLWSDAIYDLADYARQNQDQTYLLMDWGLNNQLLLLSRGAIKKLDMFWALAETLPEAEEEQIDSLYRWTWNPSSVFVFHTPERSISQQPRSLFAKMLTKYGLRSEMCKLFFQRDGEIVYSVEKVFKPSQSGEDGGNRYIFFREAEAFDDKSGGAVDAKMAASQGQALGMYWGKNLTDFAAYSFSLDRDADAVMLEMRVAFPGTRPQSYHVFVDGSMVQMVMLKPTGGFGSQNSEWQLVSVLLGGISQGNHQIMVKPARSNSLINIDFLALREL